MIWVEGFLIALEGIDGCGKSTHARLLAQWLRRRGCSVVCTEEPTDGPFGGIIRRILKGELRVPVEVEAYLFAADRAWHLSRVVLPSLQYGKTVITERYVASSMGYQSARGVDPRLVRRANRFARKPDLAIFLDVPPEMAASRIRRDRTPDEFERDVELQRRVREGYMLQVRSGNLVRVSGVGSKREVQSRIRRVVSKALNL